MKRVVVDTNVPIIANGRPDPDSKRAPSIGCRLAAVEALERARDHQCIMLDLAGEMQAEYARYLDARGQPGVGDQFYRHIINSAPGRVERRDLPRKVNNEFLHLPQPLIDARFDPSDRKFAAMAKLARATVLNATDSDWLQHAAVLKQSKIVVENVCGCDKDAWFT
jgi:hypothetical protein